MKTRWELTLRGRMLLILASPALCGAWMTGDDHARLAAALLLAPLMVDLLWRRGGLPPLAVSLRSRRTQAGSLFLENVTVTNSGQHRPVHGLRILEPRTATAAGGAHVETLGPGGRTSFDMPARVRRRGHHTRRVFACETSYPLGLLRNSADLVVDADLVAEPSRAAVAVEPLLSAARVKEQSSPRPHSGTQEFYAFREYRYGEDARKVHALRSASCGSLMRVVTRGYRDREVCLVVDARRPPGHPVMRGAHEFEWGLSACATVVDELRRAGTELTCFVLGRGIRTWQLSSPAAVDDLLTALAEARPSRYSMLDDETIERIADGGTCVWIPAGGHAAREDRQRLPRVLLLSREATP